MTNTNNNLFDIDQNNLDREWLDQPKMFYEAAVELAKAKRRYETAKASVNVMLATLELDIKQNPAEYKLTKPTVSDISNKARVQVEHQAALEKQSLKKYKVDMRQAVVTALDHRKSALERLVTLHGQNYFSKPTVGDEVSKDTAHTIVQDGQRKRSKKRRASSE